MAQALAFSRRVSEAIETYKRVIKILEVNSNGEGEEVIMPLCEMGNLLLKEGKTSEAEFAFSRVIDIFVRLYGERDGRVGMAMCSLAQVKCAKGKVNEAIDLYKTAVEILSVSMALDDEVVMEKVRTELAELLHIAGRAEEGRAVVEESLFLIEKAKGKGHPSMVPQLVNLASSHSRSKNYGESERLLRLGLEILVKDDDDPSVTFVMLDLAVNLYHLQRYEEAEEVTLKVVRMREKAFGGESAPVGEALDCLVCIWRKVGKDGSEVLEVVRRVLRIEEKYFGSESVEVMETLKKMVFLADKMGLKNEKFGLRRRLLMLAQKRRQALSD
ncbi:hypothetical protein M569_00751 [Genlisea aurea]|uniref:MalT-like TPR region domain-containing protein n=1 Tax=Genlisea aurea TaxID=192259 RepID=S8D983_9LAMI|nr:hypothetical protein M569_00751 [Genlisea aurea]